MVFTVTNLSWIVFSKQFFRCYEIKPCIEILLRISGNAWSCVHVVLRFIFRDCKTSNPLWESHYFWHYCLPSKLLKKDLIVCTFSTSASDAKDGCQKTESGAEQFICSKFKSNLKACQLAFRCKFWTAIALHFKLKIYRIFANWFRQSNDFTARKWK